MSSFILSSAPSPLPESPSLSLLPFALGPSSAPYTGPGPIAAYFQPRSCPAGLPLPPGTPAASFRGRQVVAQELEVPRGYRGVVLRTGRRPDRGGMEVLSLGRGRAGISGRGTQQQQEEENEGEDEGGAQRPHRGRTTRRDQYPLTPAPSGGSTGSSATYAPSAASIASSSTAVERAASPSHAGAGAGTGGRRSPRKSGTAAALSSLASRIRGAGQTALSRPKTRQASRVKQAKKRYRLDEDEEEDEDDGDVLGAALDGSSPLGHSSSSEMDPLAPDYEHPATPRTRVLRTPSKRQRLAPPRTPLTPASPATDPNLPFITVQAPTPLKEPLPPPLRYLGGAGRRGKADYVPRSLRNGEGGQGGVELFKEEVTTIGLEGGVMDSPEEVKAESPEGEDRVEEEGMGGLAEAEAGDESTLKDSTRGEAELLLDEVEETQIIPSPATEDDPPTFDVSAKSELQDLQWNALVSAAEDEAEDGEPIRILRPVSTFKSITLWTPDAPLPGFRANELADRVETKPATAEVPSGDGVEAESTAKQEEPEEGAGASLRTGWWRQGGAGEGGDEMVRAMGEWLGLVEMVSLRRGTV